MTKREHLFSGKSVTLTKRLARALPLSAALGLALAAGWAWFQGYRFNLTPSAPRGLYRQMDEVPVPGFWASYCLESTVFNHLAKERGYLAPGSCPSGLRPLLKQLAAQPGDFIGFTAAGFITVNGRVLPGSAPAVKDSQGRPLPASQLQAGFIPPGQALLISPDFQGGFDSRYFGLASLDKLRKVKPVLTFTPKG